MTESKQSERERPELQANPVLSTCLSLLHVIAPFLEALVLVVAPHTCPSTLPAGERRRHCGSFHTLATSDSRVRLRLPKPGHSLQEHRHLLASLQGSSNARKLTLTRTFHSLCDAPAQNSWEVVIRDFLCRTPAACPATSLPSARTGPTLKRLIVRDRLMDQAEALAVTFTCMFHFPLISLFRISEKMRSSLAVDIA